MRITHITLKNYVGIYNGMGLEEISIDMTNSQHHITVITGINGCGKSTLLKAMTILPDNSDAYIPGKDAGKNLTVVDGNITYDISIESKCSSSGSRSTKAFISKDGIELNSNGNVTSYKEVIFQEFELDSNFITLSRLSSDDRGLADKSPAERKKFMSFILDSLEVYNGIYKNLNKKSNIFKSYINNLSSKIKNTGDEGYLTSQLDGLIFDKRSIEATIKRLNEAVGSYQATLQHNDPDGSLQTQYGEVEKRFNAIKEKYESAYDEYQKMIRSSLEHEEMMEEPQALIDKYENLRDSYREGLSELNANKTMLIKDREDLSAKIESTQFKINELSGEVDPSLKNLIPQLEKAVEIETENLKSGGIEDPDNITREEIEYAYNTISRIIDMIANLRTDIDDELWNCIISFTPNMIQNQNEMIEHTRNKIKDVENSITKTQADLESLSILNNRPAGCKIDDCYFIKKAYLTSLKGNTQHFEKELSKLGEELVLLNSDLEAKVEFLDILMTAGTKRQIFDRIVDEVKNNESILRKNSMFSDFVDNYYDRLINGLSFDIYKDGLSDVQAISNMLAFYKRDSSKLAELRTEYIKQSNSEKRLGELRKNLEDYGNLMSENISKLAGCEKELQRRNDLIDNLNRKINTLYDIRGMQLKSIEYESDYNNATVELDTILKQNDECIKALDEISKISANLDQLYGQLKPIEDKITEINSQLVLIRSYQSEYQMYSDKYNTVNVLKKYSSPTTGIQTLFMSLYMGNTLQLANKVLGMIFGGQYVLCPYVINANEFRIPFIGQGMEVDDISHGSTSQVCMMGMVMNLVLKYQASPKYNITSLDEIDGGLDTRNRLEFIDVLYKLIDILEIDQLFIISHSLEIELNNVDIIKLKSYNDFGETTTEGNVLYDFNTAEH